MKANRQDILGVAAVAACALGLVLTVQSARATPDAVAQLKRRAADYGRLLDLAAQQDTVASAEKAFEQLNRKHPVPMNDLVQSALPGIRADVRPRDTAPLADGWLLRGADVTLDDIDLVTAARFLADAASGRPPWRATEIAVTASGRPGAGRVSLSLEAVEKSGN